MRRSWSSWDTLYDSCTVSYKCFILQLVATNPGSDSRTLPTTPKAAIKLYGREDQAMKARIAVAALLLMFSVGATAQTRCSSDTFGNTTCRDSDGNTTRGSTDAFGNSTWRDSNGNTTRATRDTFGNTTYRRNDGTTYRSNTDSFGNTTIRGSNGTTIRGSTDAFGNTTLRDNSGNTTRCSTDIFGNTTCR